MVGPTSRGEVCYVAELLEQLDYVLGNNVASAIITVSAWSSLVPERFSTTVLLKAQWCKVSPTMASVRVWGKLIERSRNHAFVQSSILRR